MKSDGSPARSMIVFTNDRFGRPSEIGTRLDTTCDYSIRNPVMGSCSSRCGVVDVAVVLLTDGVALSERVFHTRIQHLVGFY